VAPAGGRRRATLRQSAGAQSKNQLASAATPKKAPHPAATSRAVAATARRSSSTSKLEAETTGTTAPTAVTSTGRRRLPRPVASGSRGWGRGREPAANRARGAHVEQRPSERRLSRSGPLTRADFFRFGETLDAGPLGSGPLWIGGLWIGALAIRVLAIAVPRSGSIERSLPMRAALKAPLSRRHRYPAALTISGRPGSIPIASINRCVGPTRRPAHSQGRPAAASGRPSWIVQDPGCEPEPYATGLHP